MTFNNLKFLTIKENVKIENALNKVDIAFMFSKMEFIWFRPNDSISHKPENDIQQK